MPIVNCFIKDKKVSQRELQEFAEKWASELNVEVKDICLTFISNCVQGGQQYEGLVNLYLPSLWTETDINRIQNSLLTNLCELLKTEASKIFIITSIIQSGHVVENGEIVNW
jgi:hypothetical protein